MLTFLGKRNVSPRAHTIPARIPPARSILAPVTNKGAAELITSLLIAKDEDQMNAVKKTRNNDTRTPKRHKI